MEMQKSLLTDVNPVEKPPRRTEVDSLDRESGHDAKQTLLDETIYGRQTVKVDLIKRFSFSFFF